MDFKHVQGNARNLNVKSNKMDGCKRNHVSNGNQKL